MKIKPNDYCMACYGTGIVHDIVDWGSTTTQIESYCDCVLDQLPEDATEKEEIELETV